MANQGEDKAQSEVAGREKATLQFWKDRDIFKKSLEKDAPQGDFVFYDGPPFASGLPHFGNLLSSVIKDVIPRYKTMRGYHVRRRWGWDCHGLPIESLVEKKLGLKTKKDIEKLGIDRFNEEARSLVLQYAHDWEAYIERIGRWVEFKNSYKTMDNSYIESVWWAVKEARERELLYEGKRVLMYCTHCETPLAKAEIQMDDTYQDITEEAVTVKFKLKNPEQIGLSGEVYLLAWTTTPWTLPGNVGLAVGKDIVYGLYEKDGEKLVAAKERAEDLGLVGESQAWMGNELVGLQYEPLFEIKKVVEHKGKKWEVLPADFVSTEEGTGIVHTAVIYGEDDFNLGKAEGLPMVPLLNPDGTYNQDAPEFVRGIYIKKAEGPIKDDLTHRGLMFSRAMHTHSYPHCYRCGTPLIYNAVPSWFINIQAIKERMLEENKNVNWVPSHLKDGRFKHIVENAPDWTISRNRYWASPLPIWKEVGGDDVKVIGSLAELRLLTKKSGNKYFIMRHGEASYNTSNILSSDVAVDNTLTSLGREQVIRASEQLASEKVSRIITSPLPRTHESAKLLAEKLGVSVDRIIVDERLAEVSFGVFEGKPMDAYHGYFDAPEDRLTKVPEGGETWSDVKRRTMEVLYELEQTYRGESLVLVSHNGPLQMIQAGTEGLAQTEVGNAIGDSRFDMSTGEVRKLPFVPLPHNARFELDLHRPYIDSLVLEENGKEYVRIPEVIDCWVESGSMPFAELHYPFENVELFRKRFPGDFIAEYIAQTRTWFYYMHALGSLLFERQAFKNVISTGTILAEDGSKMSKSKGNYTDPLLNIERYGADALRYYLMGSVVMQGEDLNFRDSDLKEVHNRVINILANTFKFFELYKHEMNTSTDPYESPHVLDQWILARLREVGMLITDAFESYDTVRATRPVREFVEDFSTWFVRRSRDRVKSEDLKDKHFALGTMREVFLVLSKLIAPTTPFIADYIYRGVEGEKESVHLESWPNFTELSFEERRLLELMRVTRNVVSQALEVRAAHNLKVRQPLKRLAVKTAELDSQSSLLSLIKDEVNVKEVVVDPTLASDTDLDTNLSEELLEEGLVRDVVRAIQDARKQAGLTPQDRANLVIGIEKGKKDFFETYQEQFKKVALLSNLSFETLTEGESIIVGDVVIRLKLSKAY